MPRQHCINFPDISQENSWVNFEQKDKIVRNTLFWSEHRHYGKTLAIRKKRGSVNYVNMNEWMNEWMSISH